MTLVRGGTWVSFGFCRFGARHAESPAKVNAVTRGLPLFVCWAGLMLLGGFVGVVFWKLMTGKIELGGLPEGDVGLRPATRLGSAPPGCSS